MSGLLLGLTLLTGIGADWVLLGQRTVTDRADHDVIAVTAARGDFTRIKLTVLRAAKTFRGRRAVVRLFGLR